MEEAQGSDEVGVTLVSMLIVVYCCLLILCVDHVCSGRGETDHSGGKASLGHTSHLTTLIQSVENILGAASYQNNKVNQWTASVVETCLNQLTKLGKPFKYIG